MTATDLRALAAVVLVLVGLAPITLLWPAFDSWMTGLLLAGIGLAAGGYLVREVWRELRFRTDMCALDRRDAAARVGVRR